MAAKAAGTNYTPKVTAKEGGNAPQNQSYSFGNDNYTPTYKQQQYQEPQRQQKQYAWNDPEFLKAMGNFRQAQQQQDDVYSAMTNQNAEKAFGRQTDIDQQRSAQDFLGDNQRLTFGLAQTNANNLSAENQGKARIVGDLALDAQRAIPQFEQARMNNRTALSGQESEERQNAARVQGGLMSSVFQGLSAMNNQQFRYW